MHVGSMESNIGTIAITVTSSVEAERLKQNLMNSNHNNNNNSSSSSSSNNNGDPSSGRGNMPSIRMSHDSTGNHDVENGRLSHHNTSSAAAAPTTTITTTTTTTTTTSSSILNTHLSQRERKISQKLNPNLNPDHPNNNINSRGAGDHTTSTTATTTTIVPVVKDRKKVLSTRIINSFEISDDSTAATATVPTDRKSKSKK